MNKSVTILGGGIAGISAAYYASLNHLPFQLYEAGSQPGGNCRTFTQGEFAWDSGAHRFHDRDHKVTEEIQELMRDHLHEIHVPSKIYYQGKSISFPIQPVDLFLKLGIKQFGRAMFSLFMGRFSKKYNHDNFENLANRKYGNYIANEFLLNYSKKLWGIPCQFLAPQVAGKRLQGVSLINVLAESIFNRQFVTEHVEGRFFYPENGIGSICDRLLEKAGSENLKPNSEITRVHHRNNRIQSIEINAEKKIQIENVISTLPVPELLHRLEPSPPSAILQLCEQLQYRHVILVTLIINKPSVSPYATLYFPEEKYLFTRISEPKNRSHLMAPANQTLLAIEIPCFETDQLWKIQEEEIVSNIQESVLSTGLITRDEIRESFVQKLKNCYPVLSIQAVDNMKQIEQYLSGFSNLFITGRSGRFIYGWIHDMLKLGDEIIQKIIQK